MEEISKDVMEEDERSQFFSSFLKLLLVYIKKRFSRSHYSSFLRSEILTKIQINCTKFQPHMLRVSPVAMFEWDECSNIQNCLKDSTFKKQGLQKSLLKV